MFRKLSRFPLINLFNNVVAGAFKHAVHDAEAEAFFFECADENEVITLSVELAELCEELVCGLSRVVAIIKYGNFFASLPGLKAKSDHLAPELIIVSFDESHRCFR